MLDSAFTLDPGFYQCEDRVFFDSPIVHLLGHQFVPALEAEKMKEFITSRLWFTYRKNFQPIGGTGPTSDQGWGCMLRCGQMLLAQTLLVRHVGREWTWRRGQGPPDSRYQRILRMFQDKKQAPFSLHQIAQMGVSERKEIGEWFGPNTVAQVLKKLVVYDDWSRLAVHVALDNLLINADVRQMATTVPPRPSLGGCSSSASSEVGDCPRFTADGADLPSTESHSRNLMSASSSTSPPSLSSTEDEWRPILIIMPLRLGLTVINQCYLQAIAAFFELPQCAGIIGGRPNHALYFFGIANDKMVYLDPHECQATVDLDGDEWDDTSFHCPFLQYLSFDQVDPSLALAFICTSSDDYSNLVQLLKEKVLPASSPPMFELLDVRPRGFPPFVPYVGEDATLQMKEFTEIDGQYDSDDQFCILDE